MIYAGIDAGSRSIKIVLVDDISRKIIDLTIADQHPDANKYACLLFDEIIERNNINTSEIGGIAATGYARNSIEIADRTITEITCHAKGVIDQMPDTRTIIEIGGQDSKVLKLDENGELYDFSMNDRCAAGTGRFLEVVASRFNVGIEALGELASKSTNPASISNMCVVFAESEIIGLMASGVLPEDIIAGVQISVVSRIVSMLGRDITDPVVFTGGAALISGMRETLSAAIKHDVLTSAIPQFTGALGAALIISNK